MMSLDGLRKIARELETKLQCTCDLDRWEPERITGHSRVCNIHKEAWCIFREELRTKRSCRAEGEQQCGRVT